MKYGSTKKQGVNKDYKKVFNYKFIVNDTYDRKNLYCI